MPWLLDDYLNKRKNMSLLTLSQTFSLIQHTNPYPKKKKRDQVLNSGVSVEVHTSIQNTNER